MSDSVIPKIDPLLQGEKETWAFYCPTALRKEIERSAAIDGFKSVSLYTVRLLLAGLRLRAEQRKAEDAERNKK